MSPDQGYIIVSGRTAYPYPVHPDGTRDNETWRRWGRANGFAVSGYGQVPWAVVDAWRVTHQEQINRAPLVKLIRERHQ